MGISSGDFEKAPTTLLDDEAGGLSTARRSRVLRQKSTLEQAITAVRHRTVHSTDCLSNRGALAMIFKVAQAAENSWRGLDGQNQLPKNT
jgi:hypothetical protein